MSTQIAEVTRGLYKAIIDRRGQPHYTDPKGRFTTRRAFRSSARTETITDRVRRAEDMYPEKVPPELVPDDVFDRDQVDEWEDEDAGLEDAKVISP